MGMIMLEKFLESNPNITFHTLVENTKTNDIILNEQQALKYLKLINNLMPYYSNMSNYDMIDYQKLIYLEETFLDNEEIISLIKQIKTQISTSYIYKQKYFKRITNNIPPGQYFNAFYDEFLVKSLKLNEQENL